MSDKRKDNLESYSNTTPLPSQQVPQLLKPYPGAETFKGSQKGSTIRLVDRKGGFNMHPYSHVIECSFRNGFFTIITTSRSYILSGQNLHKIADLIDERKLKALHEYHQEKYQQPDKGSIVIEEIALTGD